MVRGCLVRWLNTRERIQLLFLWTTGILIDGETYMARTARLSCHVVLRLL